MIAFFIGFCCGIFLAALLNCAKGRQEVDFHEWDQLRSDYMRSQQRRKDNEC